MKDVIYNLFENSMNLSFEQICLNIIVAAVLGFLIFVSNMISHRGTIYSKKFNASLVVLTILTGTVMTVIGNNIALSLGMVGALSIVRFRTAIKDSRDTVYIFWAIAEGLCVGSQNFKLAIITTLFIGIIILLFDYLPKIYNKYLLIVAGDDELDSSNITTVLNRYVTNTKIRSNNITEKHQELIIEVRTKGEINQDLVSDLMDVKGIKSVNYII